MTTYTDFFNNADSSLTENTNSAMDIFKAESEGAQEALQSEIDFFSQQITSINNQVVQLNNDISLYLNQKQILIDEMVNQAINPGDITKLDELLLHYDKKISDLNINLFKIKNQQDLMNSQIDDKQSQLDNLIELAENSEDFKI